MKMRIVTAVIACCLLVNSAAFAQSDSRSPGAVVPTPIQADGLVVPMEQQEMSSPMTPQPMEPQGQASGSMVQQGMAGGASCLDCPSSAAAGFSMDGGFVDGSQQMMASQFPMDSGMGCSGCSGGFSSPAPTFSSSGCCSSSGYYPSAGVSGHGFWGGGHRSRGQGWFGRRCCGY